MMLFRVLAPAMIVLLVACTKGPETGTVTGRVTIDGTAVEGGLIRFIPVDGATQPDDCVITGGNYTVTIAPGEKRVEIFWLNEEGTVKADTATQGNMKATQMIPDKFNTQSTLKYTITVGSQSKDFELLSK